MKALITEVLSSPHGTRNGFAFDAAGTDAGAGKKLRRDRRRSWIRVNTDPARFVGGAVDKYADTCDVPLDGSYLRLVHVPITSNHLWESWPGLSRPPTPFFAQIPQ